MLIGVPGSGKTTWIRHNGSNAVVLSTDDKIEAIAKKQGKTYSDIFRDVIGKAEKEMYQDAMRSFKDGSDVIWDQTNITKKTRAKKLIMVPDNYKKIAVFFHTPKDLSQRLASRPGKNIPEPVIISMINQLQEPSHDEGFDEIVYVN